MNTLKERISDTRFQIFVLNGLIAFAWWVAFNPGFYSSDSFAVIDMIREDRITSEWTAIWPILLNALTVGGTQPQIATFFFSQVLAGSISFFSITYFDLRTARIASGIICATPIVGATGITLWHDIPMVSGFLLFLAALKHINNNKPFGFILIFFASLISSFRFNGLPSLIVLIILLLVFSKSRKSLLVVFITLLIITGISGAINSKYKSQVNVQTDGFIDWMRYDLSCYAAQSTDFDFFKKHFDGQMTLNEWRSKSACIWFNDSNAFGNRKDYVNKNIPTAWFALAKKHPGFIIDTHLKRHKYLVPIPFAGLPNMPFIHTTIEFQNSNIKFTNASISEKLRAYPRIWNYFNFFFGYAGFWLIVVSLIGWIKKDAHVLIGSLLGLILNLGLFVFATIPDARFALFVLIFAQLVFLSELIQFLEKKKRARKISPISALDK